jgi:hypothetical protein
MASGRNRRIIAVRLKLGNPRLGRALFAVTASYPRLLQDVHGGMPIP